MGSTFTAALVIALIGGILQGKPPEQPPRTMPATQPSSQPAQIRWLLSRSVYPDGIDDEASYLNQVRSRRERYASLALDSSIPQQVVESELAAANLILAHEIESFVSRRVLGLKQPEDDVAVRAALASARLRLESAAQALKRWGEAPVGSAVRTPGVTPGEDYGNLLETLQAFTTALEAVWTECDRDAALPTQRHGAIALAVLLEHERKDVAAAATLWQAVLYHQMGRADKALQLLPLATERIHTDARAYQLFARFLRCRLIADRGGHATACSLLLQTEERIFDWFETDAMRSEATNAAMLMRLQMLEQWRDAMNPTTEADEIAWCTRTADKIRNNLTLGGDEVRLLRLGQAVPMMMEMPDLPSHDPEKVDTPTEP